MAKPSISRVNVLEHSKIFAPPKSSPSTSTALPLTFFDIPWLFFSPSKPLFFYEYSHSTAHFLSYTLPHFKLSLSLALQHFFPFLGNLSFFSGNNRPKIVFNEGDHINFTVQESSGDFRFFTGDFAREVHAFHPLAPELPTSSTTSIPLLAVKVTIFSNLGISIGLAYHHVAADGRTFNNFIKTWAELCANSCLSRNHSLPCFDRSLIKDSLGLEEIFFKELWKRKKTSQEMVIGTEKHADFLNMVRATFVVSLSDMERIKSWIIAKCNETCQPFPIHLSPYVLTCSFLWVCLVRTQHQMGQAANEDANYFAFIAGGLTRLDYWVPASYFGNCVGFGRSKAIRKDLLGDDGIVVAANAIGNMIRKLDREIFSEAENWVSDWEVLFGSEVHITVTGSPKLKLYETDFGWGKPKKIEDISIDEKRAISLTESREGDGGIEIGVALPKSRMDIFSSIFNESQKNLLATKISSHPI